VIFFVIGKREETEVEKGKKVISQIFQNLSNHQLLLALFLFRRGSENSLKSDLIT
jgi:hypothetical protein